MKKWLLVMILFVLAILQSHQVAQAATAEWKKLADLPEARIGASTGVVDGNIYIIGGGSYNKGYSDQTYMYDPSMNKWFEKSVMPTARGGAATATIGNKIYVIAGGSEDRKFNSFEVYDAKKDEWTKLENVPFKSLKGAYNVQAGAIDNKIYVLGGGDEFYSYNVTTHEWVKEPQPSVIIKNATSVVSKGKFYAVSGNTKSIIYEYNPSNNKWTEKKDGFKGEYLSAVNYKENILVTAVAPKYQYLYDVNKEQKSYVNTPQSDMRIAHSSVIIDDTLYIIGGRIPNNNFTQLADRNYKSVISISLKDLELPNNTETPGDKDPEPTTPPKDDSTNPGDKDPEPTTPPKDDTTDEDGDALLVITMVNGLQKEYDLSMKEVNAFLSWYKKRDAGEGPGFYEIDEHDNNKGPFESKKDYVVFKNILMFEVNKYKK